jgi:hypothetical protein
VPRELSEVQPDQRDPDTCRSHLLAAYRQIELARKLAYDPSKREPFYTRLRLNQIQTLLFKLLWRT